MASADQDVASVQISLPQMLDLALGTPEVGTIHLNILHNFLQVLVHQIDLQNTKIEYRGDEANRIKTMVDSVKSGPSIQLHEYSITDGSGKVSQRDGNAKEPSADVYTKTVGFKHKVGGGADSDHESVIFIEPIIDGVAPTGLAYKQLEDSVKKLEQRFKALEELASTSEMIERIKTSRTDPLSDMWHVININKRLDASEQGIDKAMMMLQDLIKGDKIEFVERADAPEKVDRINERIEELERYLLQLDTDLNNLRNPNRLSPVSSNIGKNSSAAASKMSQSLSTAASKTNQPLSTAASKTNQSLSTAASKTNQPLSTGASKTNQPSSIADLQTSENSTSANNATALDDGNQTLSAKDSSISREEELLNATDSDFQSIKIPTDGSVIGNEDFMASGKSSVHTAIPKGSAIQQSSVTGSLNLNNLRNDIENLKNDMMRTKADVSQLQDHVGIIRQATKDISSPSDHLGSVIGRSDQFLNMQQSDIPPEGSINNINPIRDATLSSTNALSNANASKVSNAAYPQSQAEIQGVNPLATGTNSTVVSTINVPQSHQTSRILAINSFPKSSDLNKKQLLETSTLFGNLPKEEGQKIELMEAMRNLEIMYGEAIANLDSRVIVLEDAFKSFNEKICELQNGLQCGGDSIEEIQQLVAAIQGIQRDIEQVNQTAGRLCQEKNDCDIHTKALVEQVELLKSIKADKDDLEDALADKADACVVNRKVSCDRFNSTCVDLARGLEDALSKLTQQESIWQQALDAVQQEIEGKLDKIELSPIKEFVNDKFKGLQEKLKTLSEKRREDEAAGTKKFLSNVQCISCDKNVVMKIEESANHRFEPLRCNKPVKPYLIYGSDQMKKQQKRLSDRGMNQSSTPILESGKKSKIAKDDYMDKTSRDLFCNRYCGGSHTVTTPHQRIMRMGHFLAQWGPDAIQLSEGMIQGTDGNLYKGRPTPPGVVAKKPNACDPCTCNDSHAKETSAPLSRQASKGIGTLSKTSTISPSKTISVIQSPSKQSSVRRASEPVKGNRSTLSVKRDNKSLPDEQLAYSINEEEEEEEEKEKESPLLSRTATPQQPSLKSLSQTASPQQPSLKIEDLDENDNVEETVKNDLD